MVVAARLHLVEDLYVVERVAEFRCTNLTSLQLHAGATPDEAAQQTIVSLGLAIEPRRIGHTGFEQGTHTYVDERYMSREQPHIDVQAYLALEQSVDLSHTIPAVLAC